MTLATEQGSPGEAEGRADVASVDVMDVDDEAGLRLRLIEAVRERNEARIAATVERRRARQFEKAAVWLVGRLRRNRNDMARAVAEHGRSLRSGRAYRIGSAFTEARTPWRIMTLPGALIRAVRAEPEISGQATSGPDAGPEAFSLGPYLVDRDLAWRRVAPLTDRILSLEGFVIAGRSGTTPSLSAQVVFTDLNGRQVAPQSGPLLVPITADMRFWLDIECPEGAAAADVAVTAEGNEIALLRLESVVQGEAAPARDFAEDQTGWAAVSAVVLTGDLDEFWSSPAAAGAEVARRALAIEDSEDSLRAVQALELTIARTAPLVAMTTVSELRRRSDDPKLLAIAGLVEMRALTQLLSFGRVHDIYLRAVQPALSDPSFPETAARKAVQLAAGALVRQGQGDAALALIEDAQRYGPKMSGALDDLRARIMLGRDMPAALRMFEALVYDQRNHAGPPILTLSELYCQADRFDAAETVVRLGQSHRSVPDMALAMANIRDRQGDQVGRDTAVTRYFSAYDLWSPSQTGAVTPMAQPAPSTADGEDGPLISVVMTAYNSARFIEAAVRSVLDQTYGRLELFVVDDVSTDDTRAVIQRLADSDDRVKPIFLEANGGTYVAKNTAIAQARGELITCHDSDDWWHPQHLERHLRWMTASPRLVATKSAWVRVSDDGVFTLKRWGAYTHENPASTMFRRVVLDEIGFFDSVRTGADTEFWNRMLAHYGAQRVKYFKVPLALGLHHDQSLTTSGAAAIDGEGFSPVRLDYCEGWAGWQVKTVQQGEKLFVSFPLTERHFDAPSAILPNRPHAETLDDATPGETQPPV